MKSLKSVTVRCVYHLKFKCFYLRSTAVLHTVYMVTKCQLDNNLVCLELPAANCQETQEMEYNQHRNFIWINYEHLSDIESEKWRGGMLCYSSILFSFFTSVTLAARGARRSRVTKQKRKTFI